MKLLGSSENKTTKDKNGKNVPHLELTEVLLAHCTFSKMIIKNIQEFYIHLFQINYSVALKISPKNRIFLKTFN